MVETWNVGDAAGGGARVLLQQAAEYRGFAAGRAWRGVKRKGIQVNRRLTDVENSILQILWENGRGMRGRYSREGMEFLLKAIEENREDSEGEQRVESMNSDDRVSDEIM